MDFEKFDNIQKEIPKEINDIIYNYYRRFCIKCNTSQNYCEKCETYNCMCYTKIKCNHCKKVECTNSCNSHLRICTCCNKYLCEKCWNKDYSFLY